MSIPEGAEIGSTVAHESRVVAETQARLRALAGA
jgi:hypothetical protein